MIRKIIVYIFAFVSICLILPVLLVKDKPTEDVVKLDGEVAGTKEVKNSIANNPTIKLLHLSTGEVEEIDLEIYLYGVVSAEMPATYHEEALKTQAIVARTYTMYKIKNEPKHDNADICDTSTCCQAYITKEERLAKWKEEEREANWNRIIEAVDSTKGKVITYNGEVINAFFHANSGGKTEIASNVWGGKDYPYLQVVSTEGETEYTQYSSTVILSKEELLEKLKENHPDIQIDFNNENAIEILEYTEGERVKTVRFGNIEISGVEARQTFGLKSANFDLVFGENIIFNVRGYGHGVGLSQTGANSMAKENKNYEEIIKHFYSGVEIQNI
ncbi:MAG: stage II sporulation protein D [Clostridia bacterium]